MHAPAIDLGESVAFAASSTALTAILGKTKRRMAGHAPPLARSLRGPHESGGAGTRAVPQRDGRTMKHAATRELYAYWDRLRGERPAPRRDELDPTAIPRLLPDIALLERHESGAIAVRLAGTRLCELFQRELRGSLFRALWTAGSRSEVEEVLVDVMAEAGVAVVATSCRRAGREPLAAEMVALPLADRAGRRCFAIAALSLGPAAALADGMPIEALDAESARLTWPRGGAGAAAAAALEIAVPAGDPRRVGHLIVYDGGRDPAAAGGGAATSR